MQDQDRSRRDRSRQGPANPASADSLGKSSGDSLVNASNDPDPALDANGAAQAGFLVCGLGSLGQHCVVNLKTFGVPVYGVNQTMPDQWEIANFDHLIDHLVIGDCRSSPVLEQAGVRHCRAVLLVTQDERVNLEAALTARVLNPQVQIVMRSHQQNLNDLLEQQLDHFIAFEPTQLAAPAFALEALGDTLLGYFTLEGHRFQVVRQRLQAGHPWCRHRPLHEINSRQRRLLSHHGISGDTTGRLPVSPSSLFHRWLPNTRLQEGDEVILIECDSALTPSPSVPEEAKPLIRRQRGQRLRQWLALWGQWSTLKAGLWSLWLGGGRSSQIRQVAILCGAPVVALCLLGTVLFKANAPAEVSHFEAFLLTFITLFGGYGDVYETLAEFDHPRLVQSFGVLITLAGAAFVGVLYALLTEKLLSLRFEFMERRPPVPERDHVVVIWLGRVGRQVINLLQELKQPVVGIMPHVADTDLLPTVPLLTGDIATALDRANLGTAKSVVAVSDDEIQNLELGLMSHRFNPHCRAIIRTYDQRFTDRVAQIFPFTQVICASAISAEAFAGAAFGEDVLALFRLHHQTVLVPQYTIEADDTLNGLLLSEVAYGYGVVPIWHQRPHHIGQAMPSEDTVLHPGDRLVILASISGLHRIEQHQLAPKISVVEVEAALTSDARFDGATEIARITGLTLGTARQLMAQIPARIPQPLYQHQALRLVRHLNRIQVKAQVLPTIDA
jgi:Trk K+ transport system NAD-binding subunit